MVTTSVAHVRNATPHHYFGSMTTTTSDINLRLVWPQWQGGGTSSVRQLAPEFPFDVARRGYAVGSAVLDAVLP